MRFGKISTAVIFYTSMVLLHTFAFAQGPQIRLAWDPSSDSIISHYIIYRDTLPGTKVLLDTISGNLYSYTDKKVQLGKTYYYKLTAVYQAGQESMPSREVFATIAELTFNNPKDKNRPNPLENQTIVELIISKPCTVNISIFDWHGQKVREYSEYYEVIGKHLLEWDGKDLDGKYVPSGRYYYQVTTDQ